MLGMPRGDSIESVLVEAQPAGSPTACSRTLPALGAVLDHAAQQRRRKPSASRLDDLGPVALCAVDPPSLEAAVAHEGHHLEAMRALVRRPVPGARRLVGEPEQLRAGHDLIELAEIVERAASAGGACGELLADVGVVAAYRRTP